MEYTEIIFQIPTKDADIAAAIVGMADIGGIYIEDYSDMMECELVQQTNLVDEELLRRDREHVRLHIYLSSDQNPTEYIAFWQERLTAAGITYMLTRDKVQEEDYASCWKKYFKPLSIGKITIIPSWEDTLSSSVEIPLYIDPGMAFGTGRHETTSCCIEAIQERLRPGNRMLDAGCGSGILSIAALLWGAERVLGVDIDPNAARIALENAALNRFSGTFQAVAGNLLHPEAALRRTLAEVGPFQVVTANIVADVILPLAGSFREWIAPAGILIASGIIASRKAEVLAALTNCGFQLLEEKQKNDWVCFILQT